MGTITYNDVIYQLPESNDDVISLVKQAIATGAELRIRGSGHSVPHTFLTALH